MRYTSHARTSVRVASSSWAESRRERKREREVEVGVEVFGVQRGGRVETRETIETI